VYAKPGLPSAPARDGALDWRAVSTLQDTRLPVAPKRHKCDGLGAVAVRDKAAADQASKDLALNSHACRLACDPLILVPAGGQVVSVLLHSSHPHGLTVCAGRDMAEGALVSSDGCVHLYAGRAAGPTDALAPVAARHKRAERELRRRRHAAKNKDAAAAAASSVSPVASATSMHFKNMRDTSRDASESHAAQNPASRYSTSGDVTQRALAPAAPSWGREEPFYRAPSAGSGREHGQPAAKHAGDDGSSSSSDGGGGGGGSSSSSSSSSSSRSARDGTGRARNAMGVANGKKAGQSAQGPPVVMSDRAPCAARADYTRAAIAAVPLSRLLLSTVCGFEGFVEYLVLPPQTHHQAEEGGALGAAGDDGSAEEDADADADADEETDEDCGEEEEWEEAEAREEH